MNIFGFDITRKDKNKLVKDNDKYNKQSFYNLLNDNRSQQNLSKLLVSIRNLRLSREARYLEYDDMSTETRADAALNLYVDTAIQKDEITNKIFNIICDNAVLKNDIERLLNKLNIEKRIQDICYNLVKYGDVYSKVYTDKEQKNILALEEVDDPARLAELISMGDTIGYIECPKSSTSGAFSLGRLASSAEDKLYNKNSFIHFRIKSNKFNQLYDYSYKDKDGNEEILSYKINDGESIIESARGIYRILDSLENSMIAARIARSNYLRLVGVEVPESFSLDDVQDVVRKVENRLDTKATPDLTNNTYGVEKQQRAYGDYIVTPTSNGKNALDIKEVGGDFEVGKLNDIDYFNTLYYVGLGTPKQLLGFAEDTNGLSNGGELTELYKQFSKRVNKIQDALCEGIKDIIRINLRLKSDINKFEDVNVDFDIKMSRPTTYEGLESIQSLNTRIETINNIIKGMQDSGVQMKELTIDTKELLKNMYSMYIPYPKFNEMLNKVLDNAVVGNDEEGSDSFGSGGFGGGGISHSSGPSLGGGPKPISSPSPSPSPISSNDNNDNEEL